MYYLIRGARHPPSIASSGASIPADGRLLTRNQQRNDSRELLLSYTLTMATPEVHHLFHNPIADHSFSSDRQTLAVARDSNVELYRTGAGKYSLTDELKGHEKTVTGVDVAPNSGRIVTCSQGEHAL